MLLAANAIFLPLAIWFKFNEARLMSVLLFVVSLKHLCIGLASQPWLYYVGGLLDSLSSYTYSITRSMMSSCVRPDELGKIYATLEALEDIAPLALIQAYASLWTVCFKIRSF